eukprot:Gb_26206 [translate_table: standard]
MGQWSSVSRFIEEEPELITTEEFDFPKEPKGWTEEYLQDIWTNAPTKIKNDIGWDPDLADEDDWELIDSLKSEAKTMDLLPFYIPYRKYYPFIPVNNHDIENPKETFEELEHIEEFLKWVSYIFLDESTYEGTVWDNLAEGKGVYTTLMELCCGSIVGCMDVEFMKLIIIWGKFYFGEIMANHGECTNKIISMHASLVEVAAAKARMFVNKPDGMVRERKGPYNDPQHPYMDGSWIY